MPTRPESAEARSTEARSTAGEEAGPALLEVRDVEVHFALRGGFVQRMLGRDTGSVKAVDGVSFSLRRGEVLGLVGESGSGKTTLGKAVLSLVRPTAGSVLLDGQTISTLPEHLVRPLRRRMQPVFQDPHASLNPTMTLEQAIGHPLHIHHVGSTPEQRRALVAEALERVGLVPVARFMSKYPGELSGGQRQRASIARAIILGPDLVVADEPVSMLDMSVRAKVLQLMVDLKQELGLTYLYVTHDLATARFFCDRVAIMYLGRIVEIGATDELYRNPRHPYTRALLEAIPEPDPGHRIPRRLPRGEVPDATVPPLGCSFHPRCPDAFGPCGWESRDLRNLLEMRWAALGPRSSETSATSSGTFPDCRSHRSTWSSPPLPATPAATWPPSSTGTGSPIPTSPSGKAWPRWNPGRQGYGYASGTVSTRSSLMVGPRLGPGRLPPFRPGPRRAAVTKQLFD